MAGPPDKAEPLPAIQVDVDPFVTGAKTADPVKVGDQLRHCQEQLRLTQFYPGRERAQPRGEIIET